MFEFTTVHEAEKPTLTMRKRIREYLDGKRVRRAVLGYDYLLTAAEICLNSKDAKRHTCKLYNTIAKQFDGATQSRVERAIRHALQDCTDISMTNSEFICRMVDDLEDEI